MVPFIFNYQSVLDVDYPFRVLSNIMFVGNYDYGSSLFPIQFLKSAHYDFSGLGIQISRRLVGRIKDGLLTSARAMATRWVSPPDNSFEW